MLNKDWTCGFLLGCAIVLTINAANAVSIWVEEMTVKDMFFACAIMGQGDDPDVQKAWQTATKMMSIRKSGR